MGLESCCDLSENQAIRIALNSHRRPHPSCDTPQMPRACGPYCRGVAFTAYRISANADLRSALPSCCRISVSPHIRRSWIAGFSLAAANLQQSRQTGPAITNASRDTSAGSKPILHRPFSIGSIWASLRCLNHAIEQPNLRWKPGDGAAMPPGIGHPIVPDQRSGFSIRSADRASPFTDAVPRNRSSPRAQNRHPHRNATSLPAASRSPA